MLYRITKIWFVKYVVLRFNLTVDDISVIYMIVCYCHMYTYMYNVQWGRMCRWSVEGWHTEDTVGHPCHKHLVIDSSLLVKVSGPKTMASKILSGQLKYFEIWRKNPKSWLPDHCFEKFLEKIGREMKLGTCVDMHLESQAPPLN